MDKIRSTSSIMCSIYVCFVDNVMVILILLKQRVCLNIKYCRSSQMKVNVRVTVFGVLSIVCRYVCGWRDREMRLERQRLKRAGRKSHAGLQIIRHMLIRHANTTQQIHTQTYKDWDRHRRRHRQP